MPEQAKSLGLQREQIDCHLTQLRRVETAVEEMTAELDVGFKKLVSHQQAWFRAQISNQRNTMLVIVGVGLAIVMMQAINMFHHW
jgi:hypothetical protein